MVLILLQIKDALIFKKYEHSLCVAHRDLLVSLLQYTGRSGTATEQRDSDSCVEGPNCHSFKFFMHSDDFYKKFGKPPPKKKVFQ